MFDEIIRLRWVERTFSYQDTPFATTDESVAVDLIQNLRLRSAPIVRRWQDSQPFDKWEIIPHGSHNDETYEFMPSFVICASVNANAR